jgi:hypothetical protein
LPALRKIDSQRQPDRSGAHHHDRMRGRVGDRPILIGMALIAEPGPGMRDTLSLLWQSGLVLAK